MHVFYYWKSFEEDLRAGRLGWLKSDRAKLGQMRDRAPDRIWAFRTPRGRKGELQLVAGMKWADKASVPLSKIEAGAVIFYNPKDPGSVRYTETGSDERIAEITSMMRNQFPKAFAVNFQGENGVQAMDGDFLRRFEAMVRHYSTAPLVDTAAAEVAKKAATETAKSIPTDGMKIPSVDSAKNPSPAEQSSPV